MACDRDRHIRELRDEWRHLAQNKHRGGWTDGDGIVITPNANSYFSQLGALEDATGALLEELALGSGGICEILRRVYCRDLGDTTRLEQAEGPGQLYIRTLTVLSYTRCPESGDALLSRLHDNLHLLPKPKYAEELRGNDINDSTSPLSAGDMATLILGSESGRTTTESAKHRVREWMRTGKLPANRIARGKCIVSQAALDQLAKVHSYGENQRQCRDQRKPKARHNRSKQRISPAFAGQVVTLRVDQTALNLQVTIQGDQVVVSFLDDFDHLGLVCRNLTVQLR